MRCVIFMLQQIVPENSKFIRIRVEIETYAMLGAQEALRLRYMETKSYPKRFQISEHTGNSVCDLRCHAKQKSV